MKRKILSVLGVLMAVLMALTELLQQDCLRNMVIIPSYISAETGQDAVMY